jgi:hypothetical protein
MKIECYMSVRCGSEEALRNNVSKAVELEGVRAQVLFRRLGDEEAASLGLRGSPSVLIDGQDIEPAEVSGFA